MYSVKPNFLDVTNTKYYLPNEVDQTVIEGQAKIGNPVNKTSAGYYNVIDLLYSDLGLQKEPTKMDVKDILFYNDYESEKTNRTYFKEIKMTIPEGFRDIYSQNTLRPARLRIGKHNEMSYRVKVRAMLTKVPGFRYTAYQSARFFSQLMITEEQYKRLIDDIISYDPKFGRRYRDLIDGFNFTNGIPKNKLYVKLSPNITDERADFISNGIRSYFRDDLTFLLDRKTALSAIDSSLYLFSIFVGIVGTIALVLAFFLLLISTT